MTSLAGTTGLFSAAPVYEDLELCAVVVDGNLISSRTPADLPQLCKAIIAALQAGNSKR